MQGFLHEHRASYRVQVATWCWSSPKSTQWGTLGKIQVTLIQFREIHYFQNHSKNSCRATTAEKYEEETITWEVGEMGWATLSTVCTKLDPSVTFPGLNLLLPMNLFLICPTVTKKEMWTCITPFFHLPSERLAVIHMTLRSLSMLNQWTMKAIFVVNGGNILYIKSREKRLDSGLFRGSIKKMRSYNRVLFLVAGHLIHCTKDFQSGKLKWYFTWR